MPRLQPTFEPQGTIRREGLPHQAVTGDDILIYGSVLERVADPCTTAVALADLVMRGGGTRAEIENAGLEPELVAVLARRREDPRRIAEYCLAGAGWVLGCRRAIEHGQKWEPVISSRKDFTLRDGTRRST